MKNKPFELVMTTRTEISPDALDARQREYLDKHGGKWICKNHVCINVKSGDPHVLAVITGSDLLNVKTSQGGVLLVKFESITTSCKFCGTSNNIFLEKSTGPEIVGSTALGGRFG